MKLRLLEHLRCADCRQVLRLENAELGRVTRRDRHGGAECRGVCPFPQLTGRARDCEACLGFEVMGGGLRCGSCGRRVPIAGGVPQFHQFGTPALDRWTKQTAASFGYVWGRVEPQGSTDPLPYHFGRMEGALRLPQTQGLVLDAGCGDGVDLANQAQRPGVEVVGVELSDGGCRTSFSRTLDLPAAHVVQADLRRLPFADDTFDFAYAYGVLHHIPTPATALGEVVRVCGRGKRLAVYLYEDFSDRSAFWRASLFLVNCLRLVSTRLPPRLLYGVCQAASPIVYLTLTVPHRVLRRSALSRALAESLPYRHGKGPFSMAGDLYDRFSPPVEHRYSRAAAVDFLQRAGLVVNGVAWDRGWMLAAEKPAGCASS